MHLIGFYIAVLAYAFLLFGRLFFLYIIRAVSVKHTYVEKRENHWWVRALVPLDQHSSGAFMRHAEKKRKKTHQPNEPTNRIRIE